MRPILLMLVLAGAAGVARAQDPSTSVLLEARRAYNEQRYADAIALAEAARADEATADSASVVLARARLELFRQLEQALQPGAREELAAARAALMTVDVGRVSPATHVEYLIGMGESLYLNDPPQYAAAAEFFETALARTAEVPTQRDVVFDWWAGALDRLAEYGPAADRRQVYERMLAGAERQRAHDDTSGVGWYWLAVAARGVGDIERAWGAAVAGWIRAGALGEAGAQLRRDLDHLVVQGILPERAARFSPADAPSALPAMRAQWDEVKARWGGRP